MDGNNGARGIAPALNADLLEEALTKAFDSTFGADASFSASLKREGLDEARQRERDAVQALVRVKRRFESHREALELQVQRVLTDYVRQCEEACLRHARKQAGIVWSLQMDRRYEAFRSMDSCDLLLKRIEQTLDTIDAKIASDSCERYEGCFDAAANEMWEKVALVRGVQVAQPQDGEDEKPEARDAAALDSAASDALAAVFESALGLPEIDARAGAAHADAHDDIERRIDEAVKAAQAFLGDRVRASAKQVAGRCVPTFERPAFEGVRCTRTIDVAQLKELSAQVRASYATYTKCVRQCGLFCAFGDDGKFGKSAPSVWLAFLNSLYSDPDDEQGKAGRIQGIPDFVDEEAKRGGDDIARAVERMKGFNAQRYMGALDDDPAAPAERFWYGMKKLSEFAEQAIRVEERAWDTYVDRVEFAVYTAAEPLAKCMNDNQALEFAQAIKALAE